MSRPDLKPLRFEDFALYARFHSHVGPQDVTFYTSFPLLMRKQTGYAILDCYLFLLRMMEVQGERYLNLASLPINEAGERLGIDDAMNALASLNRSTRGGILYLHPDLAARHPTRFVSRPSSEKGLEYVYDNRSLGALEGSAFKNLRKNFNRFCANHQAVIEPYTKDRRDGALALYETWVELEGGKYDRIADRRAFRDLLDNSGEMDHLLRLVIDGENAKVIGVYDAVRLNPGMAVGVLRKLDTRYENLGRFCQIMLARELAETGCTWINDGDDVDGTPGLRAYKEAFHPVARFSPVNVVPRLKDQSRQ